MNATDNANDRCARCDCEEQMETLRRERDTAREDARLLGSVLARYTTIPRSRMAVLLWRSVRGRRAQRHRNALLRGLEKMRADGLDLDDIATAPHWTGKVLVGGRVVFDLATYEDAEAALEHERNNTMYSEAAAAAISSAAQMMRAALATDAGKEMLERVRAVERLEAERDAAQRALAVCVMQRDEAREALRLLYEEAGDGLAVSDPCQEMVRRVLEVEP